MGGLLSIFSSKEATLNLLVVGLDAAGKTTMFYKLKSGDVQHNMPSIGLNTETLAYKNLQVTSWDTGGRLKLRPLKRHYYVNMDGVIYMVDSNDRERHGEVCEELQELVSEETLRDVPFLILANKKDLPKLPQ